MPRHDGKTFLGIESSNRCQLSHMSHRSLKTGQRQRVELSCYPQPHWRRSQCPPSQIHRRAALLRRTFMIYAAAERTAATYLCVVGKASRALSSKAKGAPRLD
jgi:hypothetical protein